MEGLSDFKFTPRGAALRDVIVRALQMDNVGHVAHPEFARDLHDTVIQPLTALVIGLRVRQCASPAEAADDHIRMWHALAQEALDALRATLAGLRSQPATLSLTDAVLQYLIPPFRQLGMDLRLNAMDWPPDLPADWIANLYLVVREAVTNAEKHGHASRVSIVLRADTQRLWVSVIDNGAGFTSRAVDTVPSTRCGYGLGLQGMHDRVRLLGGELRVMAGPNGGVEVEACIPVPDSALPAGLGPTARRPIELTGGNQRL
jgi:signal transduction histidine kinase